MGYLLYLTAYSDAFTVQRAKITEPSGYILKEPFGFIHKPFEESELHTAIEITLYKNKIEKKLRNHEQWFWTILNNINDSVITTNSNGQIKFMNPAAEDLTGHLKKDAMGENLEEVLGVLSKEIRQINQAQDFSISFFDKVIKKPVDETEITIRGNINPVRDEIDNIIGFSIIFRDFK